MTSQIKVLCILGPTATGKTDLALFAAQQYHGEIINVDSAQVYTHMDIGTAKVDKNARARIPHHLFDIREPCESYSVAEFVDDATRLMREIEARNKLPILAGGTMLYFKALFEGLADLPPADEHFRQQLEARARTEGWEKLHVELQRIDAPSAARIQPGDPQRIQRALEVFHLTGTPLSVLHAEQNRQSDEFQFIKIALIPKNRAQLHQHIENRLQQMMENGFLNEINTLIARPDFSRHWPAMRAVGYRQLLVHVLDGEDIDESVQKAIYASRQLAKRQLTWLRKMQGLCCIDPYLADPSAELNSYNVAFL